MGELRTSTTTTPANAPPLHTVKPMPHTIFNRVFALIYSCAILALFYHHAKNLFHYYPTKTPAFCITLILLISDVTLCFMWINMEALRMNPVCRKEYPENLKNMIKESEYPSLDVFICTADPYKEPPMSVVNTALSVMAYEYPREKLSVYVSDDGGSAVTFFTLMEAAKFAAHWLPFCDDNNLMDRSPRAYFQSNHPSCSSDYDNIKIMYEKMKVKIEHALESGKVEDEYINGDKNNLAFNKWNHNFTRKDHPTVIQVVIDGSKERDIKEHPMPNFIYLSREKDENVPHHFKAGALNTLLRVSAIMTNAPIILTLDCDMYSNNPQALAHVLCYLCDPKLVSKVGYVQFPQRFHNINKNDIYGGAFKKLFDVQSIGFDGVKGPNHVGTGCFFSRRVFFGGPSTFVPPELPQLDPTHVVSKDLQSPSLMALAHQVSTCHYENNTHWAPRVQIGYRYGSLVEDFYTGYKLQCEGWNSILCMPERAAFLGDAPISLIDLLSQQKRWSVGVLEVSFSKYTPITFGIKSMGTLMGLGYALISFFPVFSIPIITYAFLPQLSLLNNLYIFPKASELKWLSLYVFLFLGANAQDLIEFVMVGGSIKQWWNDQRMWNIRGLTCYLFGFIEFLLHTFGISRFGFNVTSKVTDNQQQKRYDAGIFEFGVHSPIFVTLSMAALINLVSLINGLFQLYRDGNFEGPLVQIMLSGFVVLNCWPVYEAIFLRADNGKIPIKTTLMASFLTLSLYFLSFILLD